MTKRSGRTRSRCTRSRSKSSEFPRIVPWLMLNREGLSVLVHPMSGDAYLDHARFALWLGTPVELRLDVLKRLIEKGEA